MKYSRNILKLKHTISGDVELPLSVANHQALCSGGFRGVQLEATTPLHNENLAWRPIFGKKGVPYPDPNALFFSCFVLNVGNI